MLTGYASVRSRMHRTLLLLIALAQLSGVRSIASAAIAAPGQQAPEFALPGLVDSRTVALRDLKGKVVLLNIWASWCTACKDEMEDLMAVQEQFASRGFALVTVNIDNAPSAAVEFLNRLELKTRKKPGFILLYDREKTVPRDYRQRAMPTSYLIDREGVVRMIYPGSFSKSTLEPLKAAIEEALK
jgi:thiol-disulfide isomerase/thioredoxin